jgi:hypothetical protein
LAEKGKLTREERDALREGVAGAVTQADGDSVEAVAGRIVSLIVPDKEAPVGRGGFRVSREVIQEGADTLRKVLGKPSEEEDLLSGIPGALWQTGIPEARALSALLLPGRFAQKGEEEEAKAVDSIASFLREERSPAVRKILAEAVSTEVEAGRGAPWLRAFSDWCGEEDPALRGFGVHLFASLFGRGKTPEKLFEALQLVKKVIADPDSDVQGAVIALLGAAARKQGGAVERFLARFDEDDRKEVALVRKAVRKKLR